VTAVLTISNAVYCIHLCCMDLTVNSDNLIEQLFMQIVFVMVKYVVSEVRAEILNSI
jgi:hypothetical protein